MNNRYFVDIAFVNEQHSNTHTISYAFRRLLQIKEEINFA